LNRFLEMLGALIEWAIAAGVALALTATYWIEPPAEIL